VDVLTGVTNEKIERQGHDSLPTFGVGKELGRKEWGSVFRQLVAFGLVEIDHDSFGALRATEAARPVLRGERALSLRRDRPRMRAAGPAKGEQSIRLTGNEARLFEALRAERGKLARAQGVPPYIIFHDSTLVALASLRPRTLEELARVPGMGQKKLERYGEAFLSVLAAPPPLGAASIEKGSGRRHPDPLEPISFVRLHR